jgi:hypothetical protein
VLYVIIKKVCTSHVLRSQYTLFIHEKRGGLECKKLLWMLRHFYDFRPKKTDILGEALLYRVS